MSERRDERKARFNQQYGKREVIVIPADKALSASPEDREEVVGAYCRVSTMSDDQVESYELQKKYYEEYIEKHQNWKMGGIYADEGISATSIKRRKDFLRLIDDCKAGKVSLIITKSVTRFARNTVDCISTCRELKNLNPPVGVFFESENLHTLRADSELLLNVLSAMAQSDSETKSLAVKWGIRNRFRRSIPRLVKLYAYNIVKTEDIAYLEIKQDEAEIVREIYNWFLSGNSISRICKILDARHIPSPTGLDHWNYSTVAYILSNERYAGNIAMQKTYVVDIFSHKSVKNEGALERYLLEHTHEPIVSEKEWLDTQLILFGREWPVFLDRTTPYMIGGETCYLFRRRS